MSIPSVGETFRHFRIVANAGEGGMGVVRRAEDSRLGRSVALKFLTGLGSLGSEAGERMRLEARSLASLSHPNIVTLFDIDELDGAPVLVLEWVAGGSLAAAKMPRPCGEGDFLRVAVPIAEALAAAHTCGIVHRDLKPANVLLAEDGRVKLADFGLAKLRDAEVQLTLTSTISGTPAYMSPEQATGAEVGPASDIFSFGVLAYELLTGQAPFSGDSVPAMLFAIAHTPHAPLAGRRPDLSPGLAALVDRCLQKRPADRPASGAELAAELHRLSRLRTGVETRDLAPVKARAEAAPASTPEIHYCRTPDGASIAWATNGSGPVLVRVLGWFTHLQMEWEWPALRFIWERLGRTHTVVRYDGRGIGLSSPWTENFSEETRQADLGAVIDATGAEKVVLYGISEGGWSAAHYAARHPERVSHLVIYGSYSRGVRHRPGYDEEELAALETLMRKGWGKDTPQYRQIFTVAYFGADADPGLIAHFNQLQRFATDGDTAARYQASLHLRGEGEEIFRSIRVPTLVVHCREDKIVAFEEGRRIASLIPGAQFLPLPTTTHYFPVDDDVTVRMTDAIDRLTH